MLNEIVALSSVVPYYCALWLNAASVSQVISNCAGVQSKIYIGQKSDTL